jgi:transcriptional regulator with XRE-family HTH domain
MGFRIKEIREARNMSQEELARKSGVSRVTISGIENGATRATTTTTLIKLASALGVTVDQIFFGNDV